MKDLFRVSEKKNSVILRLNHLMSKLLTLSKIKQMFASKLLTNSAVLQAYNFIKKRLQHRCFNAKFEKFLRNLVLRKHPQ